PPPSTLFPYTTLFRSFVAGLDLRWIAASIIFTAPVFYLLIFRVRYRRERILAFLNPWEEPLGRGFQMIQSLLSVASGGITGLGRSEEHTSELQSRGHL